MFQGLGLTQSPASTGSLFGQGAAEQPAQGTAQAQAQRPSLFAPSSNTTGAPQPPSGSSIFGQSTTPAQAGQTQATAVLPSQQATTATTTQPPTQPAYFSSLLEKGKKRPLSSFQNVSSVELPSLQLSLDDIRKSARGLGTTSPRRGSHMPAITEHKSLSSLTVSGISPGKVLQDLHTFDTQTGGYGTTPIPAVLATPAPAAPVSFEQESFDPDNQKFLRRVQQRGREAMIAESLSRARRDFDTFLEDKVSLNWDEQRQKIYEHFGLVSKDDTGTGTGSFGFSRRDQGGKADKDEHAGYQSTSRRSVFGRSGLSKSIIGSASVGGAGSIFADSTTRSTLLPQQGSDSRSMREKIGHFGSKVQKLNEMRLQERTFPVLREFAEAQKVADSDAPKQLLEAYHALISITNEPASSVGYFEPGALRPRQFAKDYREDGPSSIEALKMRKQIIAGSRKHLERSFYREVEEAIAKNPREAQLGGVPTIINKIRAYIRLRAARKDLAPDGTELQMVNDDYCWILIFYLLRCGFVDEAAEYVSRDQGFRSMDYKFVTYMTTYAQHRRLPRDLQQKIGAEYQQRLRNAPENTVDPYRMACYKIIGRCDLNQRRLDGLGQGVEDWMWLQFALAREDTRAEEAAGDIFGLEDIKKDIVEIGQRVFPKGQETPGAYGIFFLLQILGGMFEQAVAYLGSYAPIDAVHFAIALDYYGLLRVSDFYTSGDELLSFTTRQLPQINFAALVMQYTGEFRLGNVEAAVDYFTLICLNTDLPGELGKSQAAVCHEALREFVLETRDFAKLLGDIRSDGTRIKGVIEQRLKLINLDDQEEFLKAVTVQAAAVADDKGLTADAVLLYHLAEEYDNVVSILNRILSDAVSVPLGEAAIKLEPVKPRTGGQHPSSLETPLEPGSSLSLTSVDDPVILAKNMISLYNTNALYYQKIHPTNREACGLLLRMMEAKSKVEAGQWAPALDDINNLQILPLTAQGSITYVRSAVQAFSSLPPVIARNAGNLVIWSIICISRERERMYSAVYENDMRQTLLDELVLMAKDLMVFSGMIKYKLPPRVYETLAKAGGDVGLSL
ncbi:meiotically up-regulated 87 protein [Nannizzia gypsea CBS 118893]|uniref:Meiotically up-regulated 87 protein n=1 Tax=Arthroderma gypseum (strain ATCC MYA-4604 / CBS 118893) TaxID=535722 RepID=E4V612_ARTGP|nr:meiotically up-regulated 87 protein [Nannizzia gypsea CBS 118893]EFR05537.1 meiotically up-regulated 87 protein [Nannizzia gypsea CBS 118893]